jgi:hypothetical protein
MIALHQVAASALYAGPHTIAATGAACILCPGDRDRRSDRFVYDLELKRGSALKHALLTHWLRLAALIAVLAGLVPVPAQVQAQDVDNVDFAVQLIYAVPLDGEDRGLDRDGTILGSVESAQQWLEDQTGGRRLNLVTDRRGRPSVEFLPLTRTEVELNEWPASHASYQIEYEARAAGFNAPGIINAIYYEGASVGDDACGETPWPALTPGNSFTLFIAGACAEFPFLGEDDEADWWELTFMHEFFHAIGAVDSCAPNDDEGHTDELNDLMYGGTEMWEFPVLLDVGNDDYYGHGRNACYDSERSPYLVPHGDIVEPYPTPFVDVPINACTMESGVTTDQNELSEVWIANLRAEPIEIIWFDGAGESESLGMIDGWGGGVFTSLPGDVLHVLDERGDCIGSYEMPDFIEIGAVWVMPES